MLKYIDSNKKVKKVGEFDTSHLANLSLMMPYRKLYDGGFNWTSEFENEEVELVDYYCKNEECSCSNVLFVVEKEKKEIGNFWYDYKLGETTDFSDPKFKSIFQEFSPEEIEVINALLASRHEMVKKEFIIFKLKSELNLKKEGLKGKKVGRNEPCPCGSGLKYKKCCLL